jgi:cell division protein FtsW (lipid II flippase)
MQLPLLPRQFFRAGFLEFFLLVLVLALLFQLYGPLGAEAAQPDQRFNQEQARLEPLAPEPGASGPGAARLLKSLCAASAGHLPEGERERFCKAGWGAGKQPLPDHFEAADAPSAVAAVFQRQQAIQDYLKARVAALKQRQGGGRLLAEAPENLSEAAREAGETLLQLGRRLDLDERDPAREPWTELRCLYGQWAAAYQRMPAARPAARAELLFTLAALLDDGVGNFRSVPPAVFQRTAEGCTELVEPSRIAALKQNLLDLARAESELPKVRAMRTLLDVAPLRFAAFALLGWALLALGRISAKPRRVLALALPLWVGVGAWAALVPMWWLAPAVASGIAIGWLRLPAAPPARRESPASIFAYPLVAGLMGLGFWLLIDESLNFLNSRRFLALYHQRDVWVAFILISVLPLLRPWLLGVAIGAQRWLLAAQDVRSAQVAAVLFRYGVAAALVLGVVVAAGRNFAVTSDWLKAWLILAGAGFFLSRGDAGPALLRQLPWREWPRRLSGLFLPLLFIVGLAVAGFFKTRDMGPLVVVTLAGGVLVGALAMTVWRGRNGGSLGLAWLVGCAAAFGFVGLAVGVVFVGGRFAARWLPHIGERLEAVRDPYSAANDQMALVGMFRDEVPVGGFGFAQAPWCGYGDLALCRGLPEQLASDYTVTALIGVLGPVATFTALTLFGLALVDLVRVHARIPLTRADAPDRWRDYIRWVALLWVLVMLAQTVMTVAGNLSWLPLSGVPLPFVSYGSVSLWAGALFFGLVVNAPADRAGERAFSLHWAAFAVLLPVTLAVVGAGYFGIGDWESSYKAASRHRDTKLVRATQTIEDAIVPAGEASFSDRVEWRGPCRDALSDAERPGVAAELARYARTLQAWLDNPRDGEGRPVLNNRYVFSTRLWAAAVETGVAAAEPAQRFSCDDARRALERLAKNGAQALTRLDWRERTGSLAAFGPRQQTLVPDSLFDRPDPWAVANGCVAWGGAEAGVTAYLPSRRKTPDGRDRCEDFAKLAAGHLTVFGTPDWNAGATGQPWPDSHTHANWMVPPSLPELLAPLTPLRDPAAPDFTRLLGDENRPGASQPMQGLDLRLTIDPPMQRLAQQVAACATRQASPKVCESIALKDYGKDFAEQARARMVGVAVLRIDTGQIVALASAHTECYAADFAGRPRGRDCPKAPYQPRIRPDALLNHAVFTDQLPASIVKPVMALGFLADGVADKGTLQLELAKSDSAAFLDRMFGVDAKGQGHPEGGRIVKVRDAATRAGWNAGCEPGGPDCGRFDPLFGRPVHLHKAGRPIGLDVMYGRFFVEPGEAGGRDFRRMADSALRFELGALEECRRAGYRQCRGSVGELVSTGFGQGNSRATPVGVAGMMARLALAERAPGRATPWPHLVKDKKLYRARPDIQQGEYLPAAQREGFNADLPQTIEPAHAAIVLDGLRQGHLRGTSKWAFDQVFGKAGGGNVVVAGKTGTPSYPGDDYTVTAWAEHCRSQKTPLAKCQTRPLKWYGGLFGPAGGGFEYAIAVLSERNWRKDGRIDDPSDAHNVSAEIAFQIVKRWAELKWPNAAPPRPAPTAKPSVPDKKAKPVP